MLNGTWHYVRRFLAGAAGRIFLWISSSLAVSVFLYLRHSVAFFQKTWEIVPGETQIYPVAGIIFTGAFILFRRGEVWESLEKEAKFSSMPAVRLTGLLLVVTPALTALLPNMPLEMDISAVILAIVWLGVFTFINPQTSRMLIPYAAIYLVATLSPRVIYPWAGGPLADFTSLIVGPAAKAVGIPVLQHGRSLEFVSLKGEMVRFTISPDCSSISSITVFLLLCGLMHLDLKKRVSVTLLFAIIGATVLILLNALRVVILLWVGYVGGDWALWNVHGWLGYAIMIGFYALAAKIYMSAGSRKHVDAKI